MPEVELSLRQRKPSAAEVGAFYLPGDSASGWLHEIAQWPVDHATLTLVAIREDDNVRIAGAVAIPPTVGFGVRGHVLPLRRLGSNVYLPVDAELFPNISATEIAEVFSTEYIYVWLPGRGLTAVENGDVLRLEDLIALPAPSRIAWDHAVPGFAFPQRLTAILPEQTISFDEIINEGRDDIGERADEITKLPKAPSEPWSGLGGAAGRAVMLGAALPLVALAKLGSFVGNLGTPGAGAFGSGQGKESAIGSAAKNLLERVSKSLEALRHKEVGRLLHMLDTDPDLGLKFAIPFGGGDHRGLATPGGRLVGHGTNFSLGRLGGGGPVDLWKLPWDYQQKLITKYRDLAAREIRIGRYRRGAYIYSELLGDMRSAASALEAGGHFREAAVLHKERLNDAIAAACCLERGELWHEAIETYRDLGQYEKVGDLLTQIGDPTAAAEAYHIAAGELKAKGDLLAAAKIYELKLRAIPLAMETLDSAWPNSVQAKSCVLTGFELRGRIGDHPAARERVEQLITHAGQLARHADVAELLAEVWEQYPEDNVSNCAAAHARRIAADHMRVAQRAEVERLVGVLNRLSPTDRLLKRDGRRFVEQHLSKQAALASVQQFLFSRSSKELQLVKQFDLGLKGAWRAATSITGTTLIAGVLDNRVVLARCDSEGNVEKNLTPWPKIPVEVECRLQLLGRRSPLAIFTIGGQTLPATRVFGASEISPPVSIGTPSGCGTTWGAATGSLGQTWTLEDRDDPVLVCIGLTGTVVSTQSLLGTRDAPWDFVASPVPMHATSDRVLVGVGGSLLSVKNGQVEELERFPSRIVVVSGGQPYAAPFVAVSLEVGAVLVRYGFEGHVRPFATELLAPLTMLIPNHVAIAVDDRKIEVYEWAGRSPAGAQLKLQSEATHTLGTPIAVLPTPHSDRFMVIGDSGIISIYSF